MAYDVESQLYPASTEDAKSIPMDIIRPLWAFPVVIPAASHTDFTLPGTLVILSLYSTADCIVEFGRTGAYPILAPLSNALFLPAGVIMTVAAPVDGTLCRVLSQGGSAGTLFVQGVQKWAGLGLRRQSIVR